VRGQAERSNKDRGMMHRFRILPNVIIRENHGKPFQPFRPRLLYLIPGKIVEEFVLADASESCPSSHFGHGKAKIQPFFSPPPKHPQGGHKRDQPQASIIPI